MKSRALSLAALALLVSLCGWTSAGVRSAAAQALDAGKPPAQIFSGTCSACHRSPRGLVRSVPPGSLAGFLRQHYTTGNAMAGTMAAYVLGSGGADRVAEQPPKREPQQEPRQRAKPDPSDIAARNPDAKDLSRSARQKASKKGRPEPADEAKDTPASEPVKPEPEKVDTAKSESPPASEPPKPETAAVECKIEESAKQAAVSDDGNAAAPPRQPTTLLTLPGFPPPVPEPEPEPVAAANAASSGCDPAANISTATARPEETSSAPREQPPAAAPPAAAEAPKSEPQAPPVVDAAAPALDIMQEEVHAPRSARALQKKKPPQQQ